MRLKKLLFVFLLFALGKSVMAQSGWVRSLDGYFVQLSASTFSSSKYFDVDGIFQQSEDSFSSENILLYAEYGIFDKVTLLFNLPIQKYHRFNFSETVSGVGDLRFGFKYALSKKLPISLSFEAEVPIGQDELIAQPKEDTGRESINLPSGDGEYNFWTTLALSKSNSTGDKYGSFYTAMNFRSQSFSHQLMIGGEAGMKFIDKLWLIGKLSVFKSLGSSGGEESFLFNEGTSYTSVGLTGFYKINKHWSLTASYQDFSGILVNRKNISDGATFTFGVALEY